MAVTPETARLLHHWRHHEFGGVRPFFCQIEAVETAIWFTEVAQHLASGKRLLDNDPDNYYGTRELVPNDLLEDIKKARIVITNYHVFKRRERLELSAGGTRPVNARTDTEYQALPTYLQNPGGFGRTGANTRELIDHP
jgi:hypothetical protein